MSQKFLTINLALDNEKTILVPYIATTTAEEVCIHICKKLGITTLARHLFALRDSIRSIYLMPNAIFKSPNQTLDFRIRFKVAHSLKLKRFDPNAYNYYFLQARTDVVESKVPDLIYEKYRKELLGLGITDMFRVMLEKGLSRESVESDYKKYVPKDVLKKHAMFLKKPIRNHLMQLENNARLKSMDASFVKSQYLYQLDLIAPEYLSETYRASVDKDNIIYSITLKILPPHVADSGIKYCYDGKNNEWITLCTIEELGFISIRDNGAIEICRITGIPIYLKFDSKVVMWSFITLLDGYYRLTCKWTFNLCQDLETPSLRWLHHMKFHGPVGGEFSYAKLETKTSNKCGCFIIRESETSYTTYYVDVCVKDSSKPRTFRLERIKEDEFIFNDDPTAYNSIQLLMQAYSDPEGAIYLKECIPASEYDVSPLLLCKSDNDKADALTDTETLSQLIPNSPALINYKDLQVYKGQRKEGHNNITHIYRGMWKVTKGKKVEVALKFLKDESYLKDFLSLAGQWSSLHSSAIVRMFGMAVSGNDVSLIMEYSRIGPLDQYLRSNTSIIKTVDLIEACSNLASALWHLKENELVHGKIRCCKLMVHRHEDNVFNVKLADYGVHTRYDTSDVHWIPVECYQNVEKRSTAADVWATATTFYEIFMYGKEMPVADHLQTIRWYIAGKRLPQPPGCPNEIYTLITECWHSDPDRRKQPQEISRDINQLLYQVYNSRKKHVYDVVIVDNKGDRVSSSQSFSSDNTDMFDLIPLPDSEVSSTRSESSLSNVSQQWLLSQNLLNFEADLDDSMDFSQIFSNVTFSTATTSLDSLNSMQSIFELDDCNVILKGRIGQGFYGDVFRGTLENLSDENEPQKTVAVKKLKSIELARIQDFEREINIMKTLKHANIVEILGVLRDPDLVLVMEFVPHGSLQSYLKIHKEKMRMKQLLKYANDIAMGMDYLGTKNIVHRDLATRNILVVDETHVKISDFGLAQFMGSNNYYILKTPNRELPIKWYSPESLAEGKFSVKSDVWSYGVTLLEMFDFGEDPPTLGGLDQVPEGQEQQVLLEALKRGARFPCPEHCPQAIYVGLMRPCWESDPHGRPTFRQLAIEIEKLSGRY